LLDRPALGVADELGPLADDAHRAIRADDAVVEAVGWVPGEGRGQPPPDQVPVVRVDRR